MSHMLPLNAKQERKNKPKQKERTVARVVRG